MFIYYPCVLVFVFYKKKCNFAKLRDRSCRVNFVPYGFGYFLNLKLYRVLLTSYLLHSNLAVCNLSRR